MPSGPSAGATSVLAVTSGLLIATLRSTHRPWIADEAVMASLSARLPVQAMVVPPACGLELETLNSTELNSAVNWSGLTVSQIVRSAAVEM
jgi:hypothetical protein